MSFVLDIVIYIKDIILEAVIFIADKIYRAGYFIYDWFIFLVLFEKIIVINGFLAMFAVILPSAEFKIFDSVYQVNNPLSVYMIILAGAMFLSVFYRGLYGTIFRVVINLYYLFWIIYLPLFPGLTKAEPYSLTFGYYLNVLVPLIYIVFSGLSYKLWSK